MPSLHSNTVGSSTAGRIIACPGSYKQSLGTPDKSSAYAAEGTMLHQVVEDILSDKYGDDTECIGFEMDGHTCTEALYHEMVKPAIDIFDENFDGAEYKLEQTVRFEMINNSFGTADVVGVHNNTTLILDWKFGRGVKVEAKGNKQLLFCAAAARQHSTTSQFFDRDVMIRGAIVQPGMGGLTVWNFSHEDVDTFEEDLLAAWKIANSAKPDYADGDHCKFCKGKPTCEVKTNKVAAVQTLAILKETERSYTPDELANWMDMAEMAEDWAKAVKSMAHSGLEAGDAVPGWKLVNKRASRKWTDEEKAVKFLKGIRVKHAQIYPAKLVSIPQAEKLVKTISTSKRAQTTRSKTLIELTSLVSSGTTMVREDDKREAIENNLEKLRKIK